MSTLMEIKQNYSDHLKAVHYRKEIVELFHCHQEVFEMAWDLLYDVANSDKLKGSKVLDIGSGATVHNIVPVVVSCSNIVLSDYVADNCEELRKWLKKESELDWSEMINAAVEVGYRKGIFPTKQIDIETKIRESVKGVIQSDVLRDGIVPLEKLTAETKPPYDLIMSCSCLQAAAPDYDAYIDVLKRINQLLRPGGGLIVWDFVNGSETWTAGGEVFHYIKLNFDQISAAFELAGFKIMEVKKFVPEKNLYSFTFESSFCCFAEKL